MEPAKLRERIRKKVEPRQAVKLMIEGPRAPLRLRTRPDAPRPVKLNNVLVSSSGQAKLGRFRPGRRGRSL